MSKSKEFIDTSDSNSDEESGAAASKKSKAKATESKNDVSIVSEKHINFWI